MQGAETRRDLNRSALHRDVSKKPKSDEPFLRGAQVAAQLGCTETALRYWANKGLVPFAETAGGHRRYKLSDVKKAIEASKAKRERERSIHMTTYLRPDDHDVVVKLAESAGVAVSEVIRDAVQKYLEGR